MSFTEGLDEKGQPVQHARPKHPESYLTGVYRCGDRRKHEVRVARAKWPPAQHPNLNDRPHITGTCENCGAVCIVYDPPDSQVTVVLYGPVGSAHGQVVEEPGAVVSEEDIPAAGQVIEEPEPARGKRR